MSTRISPIISAILAPVLVISPVWGQAPVPAANPSLDAGVDQTIQLRIIESDGPQAQVNSQTSKGFTVEVTDSNSAAVSDAAVVFRLPDSGPTGTFTDGTRAAIAYTNAAGRAHVTGIHWGETTGSIAIRVTATKGTSHAGILVEQTLTAGLQAVVKSSEPPPLAAAAPAPALTGPVSAPTAALPAAQPVSIAALPAAQSKPMPGTTTALSTGAAAAETNLPAKPAPKTAIAQVKPEPSVSVTSASSGASGHSSKTKWLIIAAIAAGAGAGVAMAGHGKSNTSSASTPTLSIGTPTVSVGHP